MKHPYLAKLLFLLLFASLGFSSRVLAQTGSVSGRVTDSKNEGIPGATVLIVGTSLGSSSNADGTYNIPNVPAGQQTVSVSFVGFNSVRLPVTVAVGQTAELTASLIENTTQLAEAVVVGYGTQRRQDLTGAVTQIDSRQFVKGQVTNPEQLIQGKVAGVNITTNGGQPGDGAQIRIRGGSSVNANNDPLLVIDGVPVQSGGLTGGNPLALINPNDIESYTILKDASATAIYGSRAAAGVILITTKKGTRGDGIRVNFSSQFSVSRRAQKLKVLTGDEFRTLVRSREYRTAIGDTASDPADRFRRDTLLGKANTDWQNEIFRTAYAYDNNISLSGSVAKTPYRISYGNLNQQGIVRTSQLQRNTLSVGLTPLLLNDQLKIDINLKGSVAENQFPDGGAVGAAVTFDPTQPVRDPDPVYLPYGGYFENLNGTTPNANAPTNPVALIDLRRDRSTVKRSIGNIQLDYKISLLPGLRVNYNLGYDILRGDQTTVVSPNSRAGFRSLTKPEQNGTTTINAQNRNTWLNEAYVAYARDMGNAGRFDVLAGYSYQNFVSNRPNNQPTSQNGAPVIGSLPATYAYTRREYALQSGYTRLNYSLKNRYLLTATFRADQSSRFTKQNRTGYFPAIGLGYRIKEESFLRDVAVINDLKVRASYGSTGQQDIGDDFAAYYGSQATYTLGDPTASYPFGNAFLNTLRPEGVNPNLKWETTTSYGLGLDYGLGQSGRITGTVDLYVKRSTDLLFNGTLPAGSNNTNRGTLNIGTFENRGIEFALNTAVIQQEKLSLNVNLNATYNESKVIETLDRNQPTGGISGIGGNNIQTIAAGLPIRTFYAYQQKYNEQGNPISPLNTTPRGLTNAYVDRNGDGLIDGKDLVALDKQADPRVLLGLSSNLTVKDFSLSFTMRSNLGASVYNNVSSQLNDYEHVYAFGTFQNTTPALGNTVTFPRAQLFSDYFIQNANFVRMENVTLGYNLPNVGGKSGRSIGVSLAVQNVFLFTPYSGLDPETQGGIDNNFYPRPRTYTVGFNLGF